MPLTTTETVNKEECLVTLDSLTIVWRFLLDLRNRKKSECLQSKLSDVAYTEHANKQTKSTYWKDTRLRQDVQLNIIGKQNSEFLSPVSFLYFPFVSSIVKMCHLQFYICLNYSCGIMYVLTILTLSSQLDWSHMRCLLWVSYDTFHLKELQNRCSLAECRKNNREEYAKTTLKYLNKMMTVICSHSWLQ